MNTRDKIRGYARRFLPDSIRKPLGNLIGNVEGRLRHSVKLPVQGLMSDLICRGRFKMDGCVFEVPKNLTSYTLRGCFFDKTYEISERTLVQKFIRPEDSVIELGACLGIVSCTTNKRLNYKARYVAVEANPRCIPILHRNRDLNESGFQIINCAVSNQPEVTLYLDPLMINAATTKNSSTIPVKVEGRSLGELCCRHGPFSVLIMDIEGSELEVLESSTDILQNFRLLVIEFHDWIIGATGVIRCREILQKSGFRMVEQSSITEAWLRI